MSQIQEKKDTDVLGEDEIICPTLHHVGISTTRWDEMLDFYNKVVGMTPVLTIETPLGNGSEETMKVGFLTNDRANHRITLVTYPELEDVGRQGLARSGQHIAFEFDSFDALFQTYRRLKRIGIEPETCEAHGPSTNMYLLDPDRNVVELRVDNFGDWDKSSEFLRNVGKGPVKLPRGAGSVDFELMIAAREAGATPTELFERAMAGEFSLEEEPDLSFML